MDDAETNRKFAESLELSYPILSDPGKATARAYGVVTDTRERAYRWTFYIGPDGRLLYIDKKVSTATAGEDVVKRLQELKGN